MSMITTCATMAAGSTKFLQIKNMDANAEYVLSSVYRKLSCLYFLSHNGAKLSKIFNPNESREPVAKLQYLKTLTIITCLENLHNRTGYWILILFLDTSVPIRV